MAALTFIKREGYHLAKQYTVTTSVNGGSTTQHTVVIKDTETLFESAFYYRTWKAFSMAKGDVFQVLSVSGPTTVSDPMTWDAIPPSLIVVISIGQISLAFID